MNESTTPAGTDEVTSRITQILNPTPQEEDTSVTEEETQLETEGFEAEYEDDQVEADSVEPSRYRVLNPETGEEEYYTGEELADGWMRQKTFTQKTQLLAEQRKEMEAERAKVSQEREQYQQGLHQYLSQPEPQPPSEELFETDPLAYMKAKDTIGTPWLRDHKPRRNTRESKGNGCERRIFNVKSTSRGSPRN